MSAPTAAVDTPPLRLDRRAARRQETRDEIVAAVWELVRQQGLAGLALRDLADRVGMKAPSLYSYFGSKLEIYDAMFHEGYAVLLEQFEELLRRADEDGVHGVGRLRLGAHFYFDFCMSDPIRYQLLFQRTIPDFEPSEESYAVAVTVFGLLTNEFERLGITDPEVVDVWTALTTGLTDQQLSNDPGGDRWRRVIDRAVDMFVVANAPLLLEEGQQS